MRPKIVVDAHGQVTVTSRFLGWRFVAQFPDSRHAVAALYGRKLLSESFERELAKMEATPKELSTELRDGVTTTQLEAAGFKRVEMPPELKPRNGRRADDQPAVERAASH